MKLNILDSVTYYDVNLNKVDDEIKKKIEEDFGAIDTELPDSEKIEPDWLNMTAHDIDRYGIDSSAVDWDSGEFIEEELEWLLESYLNSHPHYLVFASGCRWNGASGYTFCENITDTVKRNYEISLVLEEQGESSIKCIESSHDVPTGSTTIIVGLTEEEYERLEDAEFSEVEKFAMSKF